MGTDVMYISIFVCLSSRVMADGHKVFFSWSFCIQSLTLGRVS